MNYNTEIYKSIILNALNEDIGSGDITTLSTIEQDQNLSAKLFAKEDGILSGIEIAKLTLLLKDEKSSFKHSYNDGDSFSKGDIIATIEANGRALLSTERVMLNLLQRMCGIATLTNHFVKKIAGTKAKILDTRKTVPGLRIFDKMAVKHGGGENHRFGLYDMVLIKENHISAAGGIKKAVYKISSDIPIEVEVKNIQELKEALKLNIDRIMLDNMKIPEIQKSVNLTNGKIPLEVSGNVSLNNIQEIALTGVNYISIGKITHSVKALDINLLVN
jgi:nicotinate-nucleotide pyrophosphorylase (carboxylating)